MELLETASPVARTRKPLSFDFGKIYSSPAFWPALALFAGISALFWDLYKFTFEKWTASDGYYSHGFLVPILAGYIVVRWWPRIKNTPVKAGWIAAPLLAATLYISYVAGKTDIYSLLSICLLASLMFSTWLVAGWRWMAALAAPILYLAFGLPVWDPIINNYTNPLQLLSTKVAFQLLRLFVLHPVQQDPTTIVVRGYTLDVGVPCSGLKLLLALCAFGVLFMLIARLKVWKNLVFAASLIPLCLFINGLRIALIGVVGSFWGEKAGATFHDYSGYIAIILCFFLLDRWAKLLGWKNTPEQPRGEAASTPVYKSLKVRAIALAGVFILGGAIAIATPKSSATNIKSEAWMESKVPTAVAGYKIVDSYRMDPPTYAELQPFGIVAKIYGQGNKQLDVVVLASNRKTSFHDPRVCFPAQGWDMNNQEAIQLATKTRGMIPATLITMIDPDSKKTEYGAYFYRDRKAFYPSPQALSWSMFVDQFKGRNDIEGVFYRFMTTNGESKDDLLKFMADYMDAAGKSSGNYF